MNLYICEICGDAYIGTERPSDCPFCGSRIGFIRPANEANPIVSEKIKLSETSLKNLKEAYGLEVAAVGIYQCMADKANRYEVKAMFKRLAKIELEHAAIISKLAGLPRPEIAAQSCFEDEAENFLKTVELEDNATILYANFANLAEEKNVKKFFVAISQVEAGHKALMKNFL